MSLAQLGKHKTYNLNEDHYKWKGDSVGKRPLHEWVRRRLPKPELCKHCNEKKDLELSNISNKYLRDLIDWEWICRKCHVNNDGRIKNLLLSSRRKKNVV